MVWNLNGQQVIQNQDKFEHLWLPPSQVAWIGENLFVKFILLELHPLHIINLYPFVSVILDSQFLKMLSLLVLTEKKLGEKDELLIFDIR